MASATTKKFVLEGCGEVASGPEKESAPLPLIVPRLPLINGVAQVEREGDGAGLEGAP